MESKSLRLFLHHIHIGVHSGLVRLYDAKTPCGVPYRSGSINDFRLDLSKVEGLFKPWTSRAGEQMWASAAIAAFLCPTSFASWYSEVQFSGLEALYNSTNGQEWAISTGWRDVSIGICSWYGVTCDSEGVNVTGLSLRDNLLVGDMSEATELTNVTSLQEVDLSNNLISGPVPLALGVLPNLETLDLSGNELTYFPAGWGSGASMLRHLSLQNNRISG